MVMLLLEDQFSENWCPVYQLESILIAYNPIVIN